MLKNHFIHKTFLMKAAAIAVWPACVRSYRKPMTRLGGRGCGEMIPA